MRKVLLGFCLAHATAAYADWPTDAGDDVPVANVGISATPSLISDGLGGVFVIFAHSDATSTETLRGEHFDSTGKRLWSSATADGGYLGKDLLGLSLGTGYGKALAVGDGDGGFIASYSPGGGASPLTLSLQRFDKNGAPVWTPTGTYGGVQLLANPATNLSFWMGSDELGGALVTFEDPNADMYGQRVDSTGATTWGTGVKFALGQGPGLYYASAFISADGLGGMYYIWPPGGSVSLVPMLDYIASNGALVFNVSVAPQQAAFDQWSIAGLPGGAGCWAVWWGAGSHLYVQRFLADGGPAFTDGGAVGGLLIANTSSSSPEPTIVLDGTGGIVLVWWDQPASVYTLYAQRYGSDGSPLWGAQPVTVSSAATTPAYEASSLPSYRLIPTRDGNVAVFWSGTPSSIYGEKLAMSDGTRMWGPLSGGVPVTLASTFGGWMDVTFSEDDSSYLTFLDPQGRIFIKHVLPDGTLGTSRADAGPPVPDAGPDGGPDAGPLDAGPPEPDGGLDSGVIIGHNGDGGGTDSDGGTGSTGGNMMTNTKSGGCSSSSSSATSAAAIALFALGLIAAGRRTRRAR